MYTSVRAIKDHHSRHCGNDRMNGDQTPCVICNVRRPRRYCPGVSGNICPVCCGTEREVTVSCPLDCPYLREARAREKEPEVDPSEFPNPEIKVEENFLRRNEPLLIFLAGGLAKAALAEGHAIDSDVREALESMVKTYLTLQSGLVYEMRPDNPIAARIQSRTQERIKEIEALLRENNSTLRDSDVLGVLVFLQRLEVQKNNRRPKSRAFVDFLREFFPPEPAKQQESSLIIP
jgi:hypothetical protein